MSNTLKVVNICSHILKEPTLNTTDIIVTKGPSLVDIIPGVSMHDVEIIVVEDGSARLKNSHFSLIGKNMIAWSNTVMTPSEGDVYTIKAVIKNMNVRNMGSEECSVCGGNGWYASATEITESKIDVSSDVEKMVQDYLKILLTDIRYNKFGTKFKELSSAAMTDESALKLKVSLAIADAETQVKRQQYGLEMSGSIVSDDERLVSADLISVDIDNETKTMYVLVNLTTTSNINVEIGVQP